MLLAWLITRSEAEERELVSLNLSILNRSSLEWFSYGWVRISLSLSLRGQYRRIWLIFCIVDPHCSFGLLLVTGSFFYLPSMLILFLFLAFVENDDLGSYQIWSIYLLLLLLLLLLTKMLIWSFSGKDSW